MLDDSVFSRLDEARRYTSANGGLNLTGTFGLLHLHRLVHTALNDVSSPYAIPEGKDRPTLVGEIEQQFLKLQSVFNNRTTADSGTETEQDEYRRSVIDLMHRITGKDTGVGSNAKWDIQECGPSHIRACPVGSTLRKHCVTPLKSDDDEKELLSIFPGLKSTSKDPVSLCDLSRKQLNLLSSTLHASLKCDNLDESEECSFLTARKQTNSLNVVVLTEKSGSWYVTIPQRTVDELETTVAHILNMKTISTAKVNSLYTIDGIQLESTRVLAKLKQQDDRIILSSTNSIKVTLIDYAKDPILIWTEQIKMDALRSTTRQFSRKGIDVVAEVVQCLFNESDIRSNNAPILELKSNGFENITFNIDALLSIEQRDYNVYLKIIRNRSTFKIQGAVVYLEHRTKGETNKAPSLPSNDSDLATVKADFKNQVLADINANIKQNTIITEMMYDDPHIKYALYKDIFDSLILDKGKLIKTRIFESGDKQIVTLLASIEVKAGCAPLPIVISSTPGTLKPGFEPFEEDEVP